MTEPVTALERCVGDVRRFAEGHWGRRPLLHRDPGADGFADLLDLPGVDGLVTGTLLRMPAFRLVRDGTPLSPSSYTQTVRIGADRVERAVRPDRVLDEFHGGATIVLQALHRQSAPVAEFCRSLELALTHPVQANAYVTPATSRGFAVHHDTHDVFVLQTHGRKAWRVYEPVVELPGRAQPWSKELGEPGEPVLEAELVPGDCLYLPRGFLHEAEAREEVSIHVTVGILAYTWLDLWGHLMRRAADHRPFREALPVGFADDPDSLAEDARVRSKELASWVEEAVREAAQSFGRRFWTTRRPLLPGQMEQLERVREAGPASRFRRRHGGVFRVSLEGAEAVALLGLREVRMPAFAEPVLRDIGSRDAPFTAGDLPGGLDEESRLVLLRRLVREGALEIVDA